MSKKFLKKIKLLIIATFLLGAVIGSLSTAEVKAFVFGSVRDIPQWIKENTIIRLRVETDDVRIGSTGALFVDSGDNLVGVGTASPGTTLTVRKSSSGNAFAIRNTGDTADTLTISDTGAITATSINKVTITAPVTGSILTIADGKTLTVNNTLTLAAGADGQTFTFPAAGGTVTVLGNSTTGSGNIVLATSPSLTTPGLGVATATSLNALTLTAQAVGFTIAGGTTSKTLTVDETASLSAKANLISPSFTTPTLGVATATSITSPTYTGSGAVTLSSGANTALTVDSGTTGSILIGADASAETIGIGTGAAIKTINIGTGTAGNTINIGTDNTTADTVVVGSALDTIRLAKFSTANGVLYISAIDGTMAETAASAGAQCLQTVSAGTAPIWGNCGAAAALSDLTAATGGHTIANGDNAQIWNWQIATASKKAFTFGESSASGGSGAVILDISTLSGTSATALQVDHAGTGKGVIFNLNSVTTNTAMEINATGLTSGTALQIVGPSATNLLTIGRSTDGLLDFARVSIGNSATRDQLYVSGRINHSWDTFEDDFVGVYIVTGAAIAVVADTLIHNGLLLDEDTECGWRMQQVTGFSTIQARAGDAAPTAGDGCNTGSGGVIGIRKDENPVIATRVSTTGTAGHYIKIGFVDSAIGFDTVTVPVNGVFFRKDSAGTKWFCVNRSAGIETAVDSGVVVSTSATSFQTLRIEIENTADDQSRFFIDGSQVCSSPITTNIPTVGLGWLVSNGTSDTVADNLNIDYIRVWHDMPPEDSGAAATETLSQKSSDNFNFDPTYQADIAEVYLADNPEELVAGTLVAIDESGVSKVRKTNEAYDRKVIGVISFSPSMILGYDSGPTVRVALTGRVLAEVNLEKGPIQIGDRITASSLAGIGMRASRPGYIVGRALENFNPPEGQGECVDSGTQCVGVILITVEAGFDMGIGEIVQEVGESFAQYATELDELSDETFARGAQLIKLVVGKIVAKSAVIGELIAEKITVVKNLVVGTPEEPAGITLYDTATKEPYCVTVENGQIRAASGKCGSQSPTPSSSENNSSPPPAENVSSVPQSESISSAEEPSSSQEEAPPPTDSSSTDTE